MLDRRWRAGVERGLDPMGTALGRAGVSPDALTVFGLGCAVGTALAVGSGHLVLGVVGIALSGLGDLLDGNLARSSGRTGPRGSFFDSVADRASDAIVLGGIGWYLARDSAYLPMLAFAVAAVSMLISYERAKAEALGLDARGGLMERAERFVLLGIALSFDAIVPVLWIMLALCAMTAAHRFVKVWRAAGHPAPSSEPRQANGEKPLDDRGRRIGVANMDTARLRDWWETHGPAARTRERQRSESARRHRTRRRARA